MSHVRELACLCIWNNSISLVVLIPSFLYGHQTTFCIFIRETVQLYIQAVVVNGNVAPILIIEIKDYLTLFIDTSVICPVFIDQLECTLFYIVYINDPCIAEEAFQFLPLRISHRVKVDEEINDGGKEVLGSVLKESL